MALASSSPFFSALPCQFGFPARKLTPCPFSVRARIIVGTPLVARASASAARIWSMSWPSMATVCQPNARHRRSKLPRSCPNCVGRLWPSALTSMIPTRLSRRKCSAEAAASHTDPSAVSPSPIST